MKVRTKKKLRSAGVRAARTFLQAFLAVVTGSPLMDLNVSTLKAAGVAGIGAVLALLMRIVDDTAVQVFPPG